MKNLRETLPADRRQTVSALLQAAVIDFADLAMQAKQAHWAVVGPHFKDLHEAMDELNALSLSYVDEIAERMLALGVLPEGQVGHVAATTSLPALSPGFIADRELVPQIADRVAAVARRLRERQERLGALDAISEDLLTGQIQTLEKLLWMLQAREG